MSKRLSIALLLFTPASTLAQLTNIAPSARTDFTTATVAVTLTGAGLTNSTTLIFNPPGMIVAGPIAAAPDGKSATAIFTVTAKAFGAVDVSVPSSAPVPFNTGVECLEALPSGGCELRWEVEFTSATGKTGQSSGTTPNILATLDYQWRAPKDPKLQLGAPWAATRWRDRLATHLIFKTGYTQSLIAGKLQPLTGTAASTLITAVTAHPALIMEAGGTLGWTIGRDGEGGVSSEIGFGARGSFQDLAPINQIIQSAGSIYADLVSNNPKTLAGFYEASTHFKVTSWNHNTPASTGGSYSNVSNLVVIELGYQNNSGLDATRNRFIGRFYLYPELPNTSHTKVALGMEYSAGIASGPKIVQLFLGTNLNLGTLLNGSGKTPALN